MRSESERPVTATEVDWAPLRASERQGIRKHAILNCHDRAQTVLIRDVSRGGMKIQNAFGLVAGDVVRVELLSRRAFDGTVAWSVAPYCGIKFSTPLSEDDPLLIAIMPRAAQS